MTNTMEIQPDHVTVLRTRVVLYSPGPECPTCGRPRIWRKTDKGWVCGTGEDSGRIMGLDEDCWSCRESLALMGF